MRFLLVTIVVSGCVDGSSSLPPVAREQAVLGAGKRDIVLDATWEPQSNEIIDCRGGTIRPRISVDANEGLSVPDTLIFLGPDVHGVHIRNCTLEATFAIVAVGGGLHVITNNVIRSSSRGVWLYSSSHNLFDGNDLRSRGRNIQINGDSDGTVVSNNHIAHLHDGTPVDGNPGWTYADDPGGVGVGTFAYPGVNNIIINGRIYQDIGFYGTQPEGTLVLNNTIDNEGGFVGIIFATRASHGYAYRNTVHGGELGLAVFGYEDEAWFLEPGTCSGDPTMRCAEDTTYFEDPTVSCALLGFEPRGTCEGFNWVQGGGRVVLPSFVENTVLGAGTGFTAGDTDGMLLEANDLHGGRAGIHLWGYTHDESTVIGNRTSGYEIGLVLEDDNKSGDEVPGLELSYNDFGGNQRAFDAYFLVLDDNWELVETLPFTQRASLADNWWGHGKCGFPANAADWAAVDDPSPAATPIARAWRAGDPDGVARCAP